MDNDSDEYNLNLLRGWKRDQLRLLKEFAFEDIITQNRISGASGMRQGTQALGGKITALTRANLIEKVGRDDNGQYVWKLNERVVDRDKLQNLLESFNLEDK